VRLFVFTALAGLCLAQSTTTTYITDVNGNRVPYGTFITSDHTTTEVTQSINGRQVPLQRVEERVVKNDPSGKVTERIVRDYSPNGDLISTQRIVTEETPVAGGGTDAHSVTYRTDANGREQEWERETKQIRPQGNTTTTNTAIERPSLNGGFQTVEKRVTVSTKQDDTITGSESVYRRNDNGDFYEARRHTDEISRSGNETIQRTAEYEPGATTALEVQSQTVARTIRQPDGAERTQTDIYARSVPGITQEQGAAPRIQEQQILTKRKAADGSVIQTLTARRPTINDPNKLGPPEPISETICRGKCDN